MNLLSRLLVVVAISSCVTGCSSGEGDGISHVQDAPSGPCVLAGEQTSSPVLDMGSINSQVPVADQDMQFQQKERLLKAGGGSCENRSPVPSVPECELVAGPIASLDPDYESTFLWRPGEEMAEYLFSGGASEVLFEGITGYAGKTQLKEYRYRVWVVTYGTAVEAAESPIWQMIDKCSPDGALPAMSVRDDEHGTVLRAVAEGSKVVVVEPWVGKREGASGSQGRIAGVLPEQGMRFVADAVAQSVDA